MITIDPTLPEEVRLLIKVTYHMTKKAYPCEGGLRVPYREFKRVESKVRKLVTHE